MREGKHREFNGLWTFCRNVLFLPSFQVRKGFVTERGCHYYYIFYITSKAWPIMSCEHGEVQGLERSTELVPRQNG